MAETGALEEADRSLIVRSRRNGCPAPPGHLAGALAELGARHWVLGQLRRLDEIALGLAGGSERPRALPGAHQQTPCALADLGGVGVAGLRPVRVEIVRGDHLDDLVGVTRPGCFQVAGDLQMPRLALALEERAARDL